MKPSRKILVLFIATAFLLTENKSFSQLKINEIFATNASADLDIDSYNYINWVEIYNSSASKIQAGNYYLTDDSTNLKKWKFPSINLEAKSYYSAFANGFNTSVHLSFKLIPEGGYLIISNSKDSIIDKIKYPKQYYNFSYGRQPDGSSTFKYFLKPTRKLSNTSAGYPGISKAVEFSHVGGFYPGSITLTLSSPSGSGSIFYTTDGSEPSSVSKKYSAPLNIGNTSILRAVLIEDGRLPGEIVTNTYFINARKSKLPVVSMVTNQKFLFDNTIGIYVAGSNGSTANCSDGPKNWNMDWDRPANFEFYTTDNKQVVNQIIETSIMGGCSRLNPSKSLVISAKTKYGKGKLNYKFFKEKPFNSFNGISLRNSGNDFPYTMFRDALMQALTIGTMNLEYQAYQPVSFYLDGVYWGLINVRERSNDDLITSNFGVDDTNVDILQYNGVPTIGSGEDYSSLLQYMKTNSMTDTKAFSYVESQIDVDNFINYQIFQIYVNNSDWPGNNVKFWRMKNPKTKWRWIVFDTDFGFGLYEKGPDYDMFKLVFDSTSNSWPNPAWSTFVLRQLLKNTTFRNKFINRFYAHINSTFETKRINKIIDSLKNNIADEMQYHTERWGSTMDYWNSNIDTLRNFTLKRPDYMRQYLDKYFQTNKLVKVSYHSEVTGLGSIEIDGVPSLDTSYSGYFPEGTVSKIKFVPRPGYKFIKASRQKGYSGPVSLIKSGDFWKFNDSGIAPDTLWKKTDYNDSSWPEGKSELGYGDGGEKTIISFGDTAKKHITYYFRKKFSFDKSRKIRNLKLRFLYDDGGIIYLNDKELRKVNMPSGSIDHNTFANNYDGAAENMFFEYPLDSSLLKNGENIVAVEIHQVSRTSTDLSFDLEITGNENSSSQATYITTQSFTDTINEDVTYTGYFASENEISNLVINEVSPENSIYSDEGGKNNDWIEIYNTGNDTIDLAGLYFSDTSDYRMSWRIPFDFPDKTKIGPGEYKILWADYNIFEGPLHLVLRLNKKGEPLIMFQIVGKDTMIIDSVNIAKTTGRYSYGRIPNGSGYFKSLKYPTPGMENNDNPVDIEVVQNEHNIPYNIYYKNQLRQIDIVPLNYSGNVDVIITDISGRVIYSNILNLKESNSIKLMHQKQGMLVIKVTSGDNTITKKIILR